MEQRTRASDAPSTVTLIVDDHDAVRHALCDRIRFAFGDMRLLEADCVEEALRIVDAEPVDLVLMDFKLPGTDGVSGTRELLARSPRTSVVMVSIFDDAAHRRAAREAGVREFISKRSIGRDLIPAIRSAIGNVE